MQRFSFPLSDSTSNSHNGSEADDEGGESCWESASPIKQVIPWWVDAEVGRALNERNTPEESPQEMDLGLSNNEARPDLKTRLKHYTNQLDVSSCFF